MSPELANMVPDAVERMEQGGSNPKDLAMIALGIPPEADAWSRALVMVPRTDVREFLSHPGILENKAVMSYLLRGSNPEVNPSLHTKEDTAIVLRALVLVLPPKEAIPHLMNLAQISPSRVEYILTANIESMAPHLSDEQMTVLSTIGDSLSLTMAIVRLEREGLNDTEAQERVRQNVRMLARRRPHTAHVSIKRWGHLLGPILTPDDMDSIWGVAGSNSLWQSIEATFVLEKHGFVIDQNKLQAIAWDNIDHVEPDILYKGLWGFAAEWWKLDSALMIKALDLALPAFANDMSEQDLSRAYLDPQSGIAGCIGPQETRRRLGLGCMTLGRNDPKELLALAERRQRMEQATPGVVPLPVTPEVLAAAIDLSDSKDRLRWWLLADQFDVTFEPSSQTPAKAIQP